MGLELHYGALAGRQTYRLNDTVNSLALEQARMASLLARKTQDLTPLLPAHDARVVV